MMPPEEQVDAIDLIDLVPMPRSATSQLADAVQKAPPAVSVLVPTRNEAPNVEPLLRRLDAVLRDIAVEIIFLDDSDDDTPLVIERVSPEVKLDVRIQHREPDMRSGGLGGAVADGLEICRAEYAVIIDGDLQHPPETIPELLATARETGTPEM